MDLITQRDLLLNNAPVLEFVNNIRTELGQFKLSQLPIPNENYSSDNCPIALAFGGVDGGKVAVSTGDLSTSDPALAAAASKQGLSVGDLYQGRFSFTLPTFVTEWIKALDTTLRKIANANQTYDQAVAYAKSQLNRALKTGGEYYYDVPTNTYYGEPVYTNVTLPNPINGSVSINF